MREDPDFWAADTRFNRRGAYPVAPRRRDRIVGTVIILLAALMLASMVATLAALLR